MILEAANFDPVRAAEIEELATERWWKRLWAYKREEARANKSPTLKVGSG